MRRLVLVFTVVPLLAFAGAGQAAAPQGPAGPTKTAPALSPAGQVAVAQAVAEARRLVDAGKLREAVALLVPLRQRLGEPRRPEVEALAAGIALAEGRPDEALRLVLPFADDRAAYDAGRADCYLAAGRAHLALGKPYPALQVFDWMAGRAQGEPLWLAAEGCGQALGAMKEWRRAAECFEFALKAMKASGYIDEYRGLVKRLREAFDKARRLADADLYGEDFVLYRDAETLRRVQKKYKEGRQAYQSILKKFPDGPYAEASQLYAAICLIELDKPQEAGRELVALWHANRYGPYAGEAMLELGRIALEYDLQPKAARGCFLFLDAWFQEFRNQPPLEIEKRSAVPEAAKQVTTPPAKEKYVDFWGNVKKSEIKPGMLVNPDTCPWYLDDLKEQMAMYLGFLCFVEGDKEGALAWYKKILECDPATRRMDTSGEWNDYSRLKWGVEHGYLYAYPQELALYKDPRQKLAVLLTDFYYVTQRFDEASNMAQRMLKGEFGLLAPATRQYPQFAYAASVYWTQGRDKAVPEYLKVLTGSTGLTTCTQYRAAYCAANLARDAGDPKTKAQARSLLAALVRSLQQNEYTYKARIVLSLDLIAEGRREEGLLLLRTFPKEAGAYKELADYYVAKCAQEGQRQGKEAER